MVGEQHPEGYDTQQGHHTSTLYPPHCRAHFLTPNFSQLNHKQFCKHTRSVTLDLRICHTSGWTPFPSPTRLAGLTLSEPSEFQNRGQGLGVGQATEDPCRQTWFVNGVWGNSNCHSPGVTGQDISGLVMVKGVDSGARLAGLKCRLCLFLVMIPWAIDLASCT